MKSIFNYIITKFRKPSLSNLIMGSIMAIAIMLILFIGHNWVSYENRKYRTEYLKVSDELLDHQKQLVEREVHRTLEFVNYMRSLSQENLKADLKDRVEIACSIAENIYNENKGIKSDAEIKKIIKDAIRVFRLGDDDGYVFIYQLDGTSVLLPKSPQYEGFSGLSLHDSLGNYMVRREIELLKEIDKGYITYYHKLNGEEGDSTHFKYSYVKKFKPYGWYFGSKEYLSDFEEDLKKEVLNRIANIRFGSDGYIFILDKYINPVLSNGAIVQSSDVTFTAQNILDGDKVSSISRRGGGFVEYKYHKPGVQFDEPKIAYVRQIQEWGWIIGAGFYKNDVDNIIVQKRDELRHQQNKTITRITIALFAILLVGFILSKKVVNRTKQGFSRFDRFFKEAISEYTFINKDELSSTEFISLAESANKMILDLKTIRSALEKEHSLLRSVMNSIPDMVFLKDLESKYAGCNNAFAGYLGIGEDEILGKSDFDLFPPDAAKLYIENDRQILENGNPIRNEEWISLSDGSRRLYDTLKVLCHDSSSNVIGILCISRDITEKQIIQEKYFIAKEKAEEADRLKTAFLANMSHEIRTPMNSIVGFSNLIAEGGLTEEEKNEYVDHINTAVGNLLNLINDIIDIAKIEAGQLTIKPEYVELNKLVEELFISTSDYKKRLGKENVTLQYTIENSLKGVKILTDPFRLTQVMTNLVVNAIKFTSKGEVVFGCSLRDNELYFYVRDTGVGISEKDQLLLFKRFRQVGEGGNYKMGGTGLGLAISKNIIELMNGDISVESEVGKGSVFSFTIPYYPLQSNKKVNISKTEWKDKTIMIIENEDASYNYLKAVFSGTGARVLRSVDAKDATLQFNQTERIDLIYSVCNPDNTSIFNFLKDVKRTVPHIPVIGQTDHNQELETMDNICDTFISKPIKYHLLLQAIEPLMNN